MSTRTPDAQLASRFTQTTHAHPSSSLDALPNSLPGPLNVCIVGASRGIGAGIAHAYATSLPPGSTLILAARASSSSELSSVAKQDSATNPNIRVLPLSVDIRSSTSVAELAARLKRDDDDDDDGGVGGALDVLVLNSGYSGPVVLKVTEGSPEDFQDVFDVNVQGMYLVAHHLFPLLLARGQRGPRTFVAVGSFAALLTRGHIANTAYCVSKFAQTRLIEYLGEQFGKDEDGGVVSVAVHPGAVLTEMADAHTPDSFRSHLTDDVRLCGAFCVWLTRERRTWLNGRLVSAKWDVDELLAKQGSIEENDLLRFGLRVGDASSA